MMDWDWQIRTQAQIKLLWRLPPKDIRLGRAMRANLQKRLDAVADKLAVSLQGELVELVRLAGGEMTDEEFVAAVEAAGLSVKGKE